MRADTFDSCHSRLVARVLVTPRPLYLVSLLASWPAICLSLWPSLPQSGLITRRHFMEIIPGILCLIYSRGILQDLMSAASAVDLRWWTSHKNNSALHVCFVLYESWDRPLIRGRTRSNKTFPFWFCNYNKLLFWSGDEGWRGGKLFQIFPEQNPTSSMEVSFIIAREWNQHNSMQSIHFNITILLQIGTWRRTLAP